MGNSPLDIFDDIKALLYRADEHLTWIKEISGGRHEINNITNDSDLQTGRVILKKSFDLIAIQVRIRVGECANSLRSAMNYFTCALAEQSSNRVGKYVQFPIEDYPDVFKSRRHTHLEGISEEYIALFEKFQPYKGCDWMASLRDLSNFHKHRRLIHVKKDVRQLTWFKPVIQTIGGTPSNAMKMEHNLLFKVTLEDGRPIVQSLEIIHLRVTEMLDELQALLKKPD